MEVFMFKGLFGRKKQDKLKEIGREVEAVHMLVKELRNAVTDVKEGHLLLTSQMSLAKAENSQTFGNLGEKLERIEKALEFSGIFNAMSEPIKPTAEEAVPEKTRKEIEAESVTVKQIINEWLNGEENEG